MLHPRKRPNQHTASGHSWAVAPFFRLEVGQWERGRGVRSNRGAPPEGPVQLAPPLIQGISYLTWNLSLTPRVDSRRVCGPAPVAPISSLTKEE